MSDMSSALFRRSGSPVGGVYTTVFSTIICTRLLIVLLREFLQLNFDNGYSKSYALFRVALVMLGQGTVTSGGVHIDTDCRICKYRPGACRVLY